MSAALTFTTPPRRRWDTGTLGRQAGGVNWVLPARSIVGKSVPTEGRAELVLHQPPRSFLGDAFDRHIPEARRRLKEVVLSSLHNEAASVHSRR